MGGTYFISHRPFSTCHITYGVDQTFFFCKLSTMVRSTIVSCETRDMQFDRVPQPPIASALQFSAAIIVCRRKRLALSSSWTAIASTGWCTAARWPPTGWKTSLTSAKWAIRCLSRYGLPAAAVRVKAKQQKYHTRMRFKILTSCKRSSGYSCGLRNLQVNSSGK